MRRKDKEIYDIDLIKKILNEARIIRIAMCDGNEPYLVAMNFVYMDGSLYMHSAMEGRKIDVLMKNNRVAFQTDIGVELFVEEKACNFSMKYMSIVGIGRAYLINDRDVKINALNGIMEKYTGKAVFEYAESLIEKTLIVKIEIDSLSGKKSKY